MLDGALNDLRIAFRQLLRTKGFTITAILTLALGLGANTAIFTLVHNVMFRSLAVANPDQLFRLGDSDKCCVTGGYQGKFSIFSYPLYGYMRDHTPEFEELAAFQAGNGRVGVRRAGPDSVSEPYTDEFVSGNYFSMFGLTPFAGRLFVPEDDRRGAPPVAVISHRIWTQRYASDPAVIGSSFVIDGASFTVVGVAPPGFFGDTLRPDPPDFWMPLATEPVARGANSLLDRKSDYWLYVIGRAKRGTQIAALEARVNAELRQWLAVNDPPTGDRAVRIAPTQHLSVVPAGNGISTMRQDYANDLRLLLAITGLVLVVACANLANLQLARGAARSSHTAIRVALGASRARLIRLTLIESLLLAVIGGGVGLLVANELTAFLIRLAFQDAASVPIDSAPSLPVLGFAFLLSIVTGVLFGIAPAWTGSRADPAAALRGSGRSTTNRVTLMQKSLVVVQTALSMVLIAGAGLMLLTLRNLTDQQFGFQSEGRLIVNVHAGFSGYPPAKLKTIYDEIERQVKQIPGIRDVGLSLYSPMGGENWQMGVSVEEQPGQVYEPAWDRVSHGFFETLGSRILHGRMFDERDSPDAAHVAVVNQAFVDKIFPNEDPLGKRFGLGDVQHRADYQIVGVVENVRFRNPRVASPPMFFVPLLQMSASEWTNNTKSRSNLIGNIELHVANAPEGLHAKLQRVLSGIDPNLTLLNINSIDGQLENQLGHEVLIARLAQLFGLLALAVASVGLYGVTAYAVAQRTSEIGIRCALGANRSHILKMILGGALGQAAIGLAIGVPAALAGGRLLADQLYGVKTYDARILIGAAAVLMLSACAAGIFPALQASRVDPVRTLRSE
jgi:macrolide transport system ATP-binding/permease protein